jgi:glycerol-3-phosphate acyltransferase PlsY
MTPILFVAIGFLFGSMPFSYWLGKLLLHEDIRDYGDGNPGAFNIWKAGGADIGLLALLLDYLKGNVPVMIAHFGSDVNNWWLFPIALSPVIGHAFSPFLGFKGGKALAATFGIWSGLTLWRGPIALGLSLGIISQFQTVDGWSVILSMLGLLAYLLIDRVGMIIVAIWCGNILILAWKYRFSLKRGIHLKNPFSSG